MRMTTSCEGVRHVVDNLGGGSLDFGIAIRSPVRAASGSQPHQGFDRAFAIVLQRALAASVAAPTGRP